MPLHDSLEDALSIVLNDVAMARDDPLEIPGVDLRNAPVEPRPVRSADEIPDEPSLRQCLAACVVDVREEFCEKASIWVLLSIAKLLCCRQIEHQICFDEGACGSVVEDELFVTVGVDVFVVELCVKLCRMY